MPQYEDVLARLDPHADERPRRHNAPNSPRQTSGQQEPHGYEEEEVAAHVEDRPEPRGAGPHLLEWDEFEAAVMLVIGMPQVADAELRLQDRECEDHRPISKK